MKITWLGDVAESFDWKVGDSFYDDDYPRSLLSAAHAGKRPIIVWPIIVCLPGGIYFCIYSMQITHGRSHEPGWGVSGEPGNLTLQPSVNVKDIWHGFITNGSFSPDIAERPAPTPQPTHVTYVPPVQGVAMTTHTQWIEVHSDGAAPITGWRCDGCGQVKWQDDAPDEACDICAEAAPVPETSAPPTPPENLEPPKPASRRARGGGPPNPERAQ